MKLSTFLKRNLLMLFGALAVLLGQAIGLLIDEHRGITHLTITQKPADGSDSAILICFVTNSASAHQIYPGKGKP